MALHTCISHNQMSNGDPSMTLVGSVCKRRCADLRLEGFGVLTKPCFEDCYRDFNSSSAREHEYHMKPKRPVSCVFSCAT